MKDFHNIVVGDISTNCWIYPLDKAGACAVIDPGGEPERIIALLDQLRLFPALVLLTHGHFDHLSAVPGLAAEYRARGTGAVEIAIHSADAGFLGSDSRDAHCHTFAAAGGSSAYIDALWSEMPPADRLLAEGDSAGPFSVLHLPGHTPGSVAFWDREAGALFVGDTLFCGGYGRTDLPGGDHSLLAASLARLSAMDGGIKVFPGHGGATTIADERM